MSDNNSKKTQVKETKIVKTKTKTQNNNLDNNEENYFKKNYNIDINLLDADDEFDRLYLSKISDLKLEFKEYIDNECLPFLNSTKIKKYDFYDFIKNNSINYKNIEYDVEEKNEEYLKQLEEEIQHEFEEDLYIDD